MRDLGLGAVLFSVALSGCGQGVPGSIYPNAPSQTTVADMGESVSGPITSRIDYVFPSSAVQGALPIAQMVAVDGVLYGTTVGGGAALGQGRGTIFSFDPTARKQRVLLVMKGSAGDTGPLAPLLAEDGTFFGTTPESAFSFDAASGSKRTLHRFTYAEGIGISAGLIEFNGRLYGTAFNGGAPGANCFGSRSCGTVFSLDPSSGQERTLYQFHSADGDGPAAALVATGGILYGTTEFGGTGCPATKGGCGTVFSVDPVSGGERVLHSFSGAPDGSNPTASLVPYGGKLYGTTAGGGNANCDYLPNATCGTVFSIDLKTGAEKVLYRFKGLSDGFGPVSSLVVSHGLLFGTTYLGGSRPNPPNPCALTGCGTAFSIDPTTGAERVLYRFPKGGMYPSAALTAVGNSLYGTTRAGGAANCMSSHSGCGLLFSITLSPNTASR